MTLVNTHSIKCSCGNIVDVEIYDSVNVTVNPELRKKIRDRKINNYECKKCGVRNELAHRFLYVDMDISLWVWCYPETRKKDRTSIEKEVLEETGLFSGFSKKTGIRSMLVFGYDELLKRIEREKKQ